MSFLFTAAAAATGVAASATTQAPSPVIMEQLLNFSSLSVLNRALLIAIGLLIAAIGCTAVRLLKGPSVQDRILALDCMYLNTMLLILVLPMLFASTVYFEAALLIALLACVSSIAMAKFLLRGEVIE